MHTVLYRTGELLGVAAQCSSQLQEHGFETENLVGREGALGKGAPMNTVLSVQAGAFQRGVALLEAAYSSG